MALRVDRRGEVILADDDEDDYYFLKQAFHAYSDQISVHYVAQSSQLMDHLQTGETLPSLLLLDIHMPSMDGDEVLATLKADARLKDIPVLVWSGSISQADVNRCYELGASAVLLKPSDLASLQEMIQPVCNDWFNAVLLPDYPKQSTG